MEIPVYNLGECIPWDMRGAYRRSNTSVKEKVGLSAGSLYAGRRGGGGGGGL